MLQGFELTSNKEVRRIPDFSSPNSIVSHAPEKSRIFSCSIENCQENNSLVLLLMHQLTRSGFD